MATLNPDKLKEALSELTIRVIEAQQQAVITGMFNLQADYLQRIFNDGQTSKNEKIGSYSTKPMYASPESLSSQVRKSSIKPKGKNSNDPTFENGKKRKSQYLPGGYAELRQVLGRQNQTVDLALTFALRGSIQVGVQDDKVVMAFNNDKELEKAKGNEKRFGKVIFDASEEEINTLVKKWENDVTEAYFKSFE